MRCSSGLLPGALRRAAAAAASAAPALEARFPSTLEAVTWGAPAPADHQAPGAAPLHCGHGSCWVPGRPSGSSQPPRAWAARAAPQQLFATAARRTQLHTSALPHVAGGAEHDDCGGPHVVPLDQVLANRPQAAGGGGSGGGSSSTTKAGPAPEQQDGSATEQLVSELFDAELERRLLAAAAAATRPAADDGDRGAPPPPPPPAGQQQRGQEEEELLQHQHQQQQQRQAGVHQPGVAPSPSPLDGQYEEPGEHADVHPPPAWRARSAAADDPWSPLPSPQASRRRLQSQLLQMLHQAGVPPGVASAALEEAATDAPGTGAAGQPGAAASRAGGQRARRSAAAAGAGGGCMYLAVLNRLRAQQLAALLEDCQAPTYGSKPLLLRRVVMLLQEQRALAAPAGRAGAVAGAGGCDDAAARPAPFLGGAPEQQEGEARRRPWGGGQLEAGASRGLPAAAAEAAAAEAAAAEAAAQQRRLDSMVDPQEIGGWLMAARAQDVCVVDVGGRAGLHRWLVVASALSQRHGHACAAAVAWQLQQKAAAAAEAANGAGGGAQAPAPERLLPPLHVLGDAEADWSVLDAAGVAVHVLTERARRFYDLEGLWGGARGEHVRWLRPQGPAVETKDTIGRRRRGRQEEVEEEERRRRRRGSA